MLPAASKRTHATEWPEGKGLSSSHNRTFRGKRWAGRTTQDARPAPGFSWLHTPEHKMAASFLHALPFLKQEREGELFCVGSNDVPSFFSRGFAVFQALSWASVTSMRAGGYWLKPLSIEGFVIDQELAGKCSDSSRLSDSAVQVGLTFRPQLVVMVGQRE